LSRSWGYLEYYNFNSTLRSIYAGRTLKSLSSQDAKSPLLKLMSSGLRFFAKWRKLVSRAIGSNR
jgi:hypothetical protein